MKRLGALVLRSGAMLLGLLPQAGALGQRAFEPIFDGRSFAGWEHSSSHWRIEEGAIAGEIPAGERLERNLFLFFEEELHDFELELEFRITGDPSANSGVQVRSLKLDDGGAAGYQADIDGGEVWLGRIYDEHGRGLLCERGTTATTAADGTRRVEVFRPPEVYRGLVHAGDWNRYAVRAAGARIETRINGERAAVLIDGDVRHRDGSGFLALQLHSGPGPAKVEFRNLRLRRLGKTVFEPPPPADVPARDREGIAPRGADGELLNLGFERGSLEGWTATGNAWEGQPIRGDTVTPRRPGQASEHAGEFWLGGYEVLRDEPTGTLESAPFEVTHPWASFLAGGGPHHETRVEVVDAASGEVIHHASGSMLENLEPVVVDLRGHAGRRIAVRIVDAHSGAWGHVNYDDFRFHDELPQALAEALRPHRVRTNPILSHLRKNPAAASLSHLRTNPATEGDYAAARTLAGMYVPDGFQVELIAAEPDVRQPIAFAFDERGRIWVAEAFSYPARRPPGEGLDRIVIFADADGDGSFETRKVFAEGLNLASGLEVGFGGVWVGAAPELLFIPDRDCDDVPDGDPVVLLDGWGFQDTHETLNSFTWGPDGWLYGNQGVFNTSHIGKPGASAEERTVLHAGVWRYHPVRHEFEVFARGGSNQWGLAFNARGQLFMTHCRSFWGRGPTTHVVEGGHYWNQANARHAPFVSGSHPPGIPHLRNFLLASARYGHGEGGAGARGSRAIYGGHSHVGTMVYLGDNWPAEYRDHLFTHNLHGHQINHQVNVRRGSGYETLHAGEDLLWVADPLYVAVDLDWGPDGAVYIIDWYDRQHCHSPHMERWDRSNGRIYRMSWAATFKPRSADLAAMSDLELARLQTHENAWYARTARRILQERGAAGAVGGEALAVLRSLVEDPDPVRVLRGLWTLHVAGALERDLLDRSLAHEDEDIRGWAVRLATADATASRAFAPKLLAMARSDPSPRVRLALASWLARAPASDAWPLAEALAAHGEDAGDPYLPRMVWFGIAPYVHADLERAFALAEATPVRELADFVHWYAARTPAGRERLLASVRELGSGRERRTLELILFALESSPGATAPAVWRQVGPSLLESKDSSVRESAERLGGLFGDGTVLARMRDDLADARTPPARRRRAFDVLRRVSDAKAVPSFIALLDEPAYRSEVIGLLARTEHSETAPALVERLESFSEEDRRRALETLAARPSFARPLLESIVAGRTPKAVLSSFHVRQLRNLRDEAIDRLVTEVWGRVRDTAEEARAKIAAYAKLFREAPLWAYDTGAGRQVFEKACASCHPHAGGGGKLGPDLTGAGRNGPEYFLESILDPNAVVGEDYQVTLVVLKDGAVLNGLIESETDESLTVRLVNETRTVRKSNIAAREKQETSFMPEGLFDPLSEREVIELLKYLTSLR